MSVGARQWKREQEGAASHEHSEIASYLVKNTCLDYTIAEMSRCGSIIRSANRTAPRVDDADDSLRTGVACKGGVPGARRAGAH